MIFPFTSLSLYYVKKSQKLIYRLGNADLN